VFLPIKTRLLRQELSLATPIDPRINQAFTLKELISAVQDAKNTTPRPDSSCYEMFKHLSTKSLEVMLQLFNKIWFTGNSSVLAAFQCSSSGQAKPTLALTGQYALPAVCANSLKKWSYVDSAGLWSTTRSLVSPSPASDSAEKQRSHSPSP